MADAIRDENHRPVAVALSYIDGVTIVPIVIDASNSGIEVDEVNTIGFTPTEIAKRDHNDVPLLMGIDSVTGVPFPLLADPVTGGILIDIV